MKPFDQGLFTTVQDEGRWGYQAYGMPVAGAMDRYAYRVANLLAGNRRKAAALEMTLLGGAFRFLSPAAWFPSAGRICGRTWTGTGCRTGRRSASPPGRSSPSTPHRRGAGTYLAVRGGIAVPVVLGSRSTYTRASIGGFEGRVLRAGDILSVGKRNSRASHSRRPFPNASYPAATGKKSCGSFPAPRTICLHRTA